MRSTVNVTIGALRVGERRGVHVVGVRAVARDTRGRQVDDAGVSLLRTDESELPVFAAGRGGRRDPLRFGTTRWLDRQHAPPREELAVRQRCARGDLRGDGTGGPVRRQRVGGTEEEHVGTVGQHDQREHLPGLGLLQERSEEQPGLRGAGVADHRREVVDHVRRRRACRRPHAPTRWAGATTAAAATSPAVSPADSSAAFHACTPSGT